MYAEAGYAGEFWTLSNPLSYGYSARNYAGSGAFGGGGFKWVTDAHHMMGYGMSAVYLQYEMDKALHANENVSLKYSFLKFSPMAYLAFTSRSAYHFQLCGVVSIMAPLTNNERAYIQYGAKVCAGYKAYEVNLGIGFGQLTTSPSTDIQSKWREQMVSLGLACYPGRIPVIRKYAGSGKHGDKGALKKKNDQLLK